MRDKIINKKKIIGIIPARSGSIGIKGKNLKYLHGKPLIAWTIECALRSNLSRVLVTTESEEIAKVAREYGAEVPFLRPNELSSNTAPIEPVLLHAIEWLRDNEGYECDAVALIFPTHPLRKPQHIDECVEEFCSNNCDSVVSVDSAIANDNPHWMLKKNGQGEVVLFTGKPLSEIEVRRQDLPIVYKRNDLVYVLKEENLKQDIPTLYGRKTKLVESSKSYDIDLNTEDDWRFMEDVFQALIKRNSIE